MKILYIIHADFELPGVIVNWAQKNQFTETYARPFAREKLPSDVNFDLLIVMGGPQSPLNIEEAPYLQDEINLIQRALQRGVPILGFCLGAQLIGEALGARTEKSPFKEVGVFPIELTQEGTSDRNLKGLPKKFLCSHWHNDMPGLTKESKILASSEGCPRQIVRYLENVYGFQCHPEITRKSMESLIQSCPEDFVSGKYIQSPEVILKQNFEEINNRMINFLDNFISHITVSK